MDIKNYLTIQWSDNNESGCNCWGFVQYIYYIEKKIKLSNILVSSNDKEEVLRAFKDEKNYSKFDEVCKFKDLDVIVLLSNQNVCHCGIFIKPCFVLHNTIKGVFLTHIDMMKHNYSIVKGYRLK